MIGDRVRHYRTKRGLYLVDVATEVGVSTAHLSRLERGERRITDRAMVVNLARVLGCSPAELMGHPIDWADPDMADAQASVAATRLALATTELGQPGDQAAPPVATLLDDTRRVVQYRTDCDLVAMGAMLPDLIQQLHTAYTEVTDDDGRNAVLYCLLVCAGSAMTLAHGNGYAMEAWVAAQRSRSIAEKMEHPGWRAVAAFTGAHALLAMGGHEQAHRLASTAADEASAITGNLSDQPARAAYGSLLLASALTASVTGRPDESADRLVAAADVAEQTGQCSPLVALFGPTNVAIYSMQSAVERGDHAAAVSLARSVRVDELPAPERRAKFHIDLARSLAATDADDDAVVELRRAEQAAKARLYGHTFARQTVCELRDRVPRDTEGGRSLRSLAYRMNLAN